MRRLDPIEHLPDGTLFRLTPGQVRSVRKLVKRCCNFADGDCLPLDGTCPQAISHSLICRWFRHAVLPEQPKLEQAILTSKKLHRCQVSARTSSPALVVRNTASNARPKSTGSRKQNPPADGAPA